MTTYIQRTIFYYWRHIVPFISSLYYSTLEFIDPFLCHPSFYALAIHLLPGPVISHHLHPYSLIAIKARCVCQTLFQRVIHSRFQQQGVPEMHTGLAPTKTPVCHLWYQSGTLDWRTCQNIVILPFLFNPEREAVAGIYTGWSWRVSKNYLLPTHRFAVITHAWTRTVFHHIDACIYHTSVCLFSPCFPFLGQAGTMAQPNIG